MTERTTIRSYRRVFDVDRRIYRVDRWVLPVPGGIPLRGMAYFTGTLLFLILFGWVPPLTLLNGPMKYVLIPLAVAVLGTQATPDGRPAHRFALAWLGVRWRSRTRPVTWTWRTKLPVGWDGDSPVLRRCHITGPARVRITDPVEWSETPRGVTAYRDRGEPNTTVVIRGRGATVR